jgi:hypothetical protein
MPKDVDGEVLLGRHTERLEFMYRGAMATKQEADEYLLGKPVELKDEMTNIDEIAVIEQVKVPVSMFTDDTPKSQNEQWARLNNDPMLMVRIPPTFSEHTSAQL